MKKIFVSIFLIFGAAGMIVHIVMPVLHVFYPKIPSAINRDLRGAAYKSYPSPDGRYAAFHLRYVSGGSVSSQCDDIIAIAPADVKFDALKIDRSYDIYSAECDDFSDHQSAPVVVWRSNSTVEISFSLNSTALLMRDVRLKAYDRNHHISVGFSAHT